MRLGIKKILGLAILASFFYFQPALAQNAPVNAYLFYGEGCPHCALEKQYLSGSLKNEFPDLRIFEYEIYRSKTNVELLLKVSEKLGVKVEGVPFLVIGDQHFIGFAESLSPQMIERRVKECSAGACTDSVAAIVGVSPSQPAEPAVPEPKNDDPEPDPLNGGVTDNPQPPTEPMPAEEQNREKKVTLPLFGEVNVAAFSLPMLTAIMGAMDGFNPCAMWTLLFLISLLLGMENRKRMWILGTAFIVASASVYFFFMSAWLNLILFLGFVTWIKILVGCLAILGGSYSLKEFFSDKTGGCKIAGGERRTKTFDRLKLVVQQNSLWLALGGIVALAFAVNLVELVCSAGLPAIYTQVLALNGLQGWQYYLYILLYIFFFMLDDLFIFFIAMITLQMTGVTTKYARISRLVGGLVMLTIGLLLIFKPAWLMF
jgi:glutaredoxin